MRIKQESVEIRMSLDLSHLYRALSQLTLQKKKELQAFLGNIDFE